MSQEIIQKAQIEEARSLLRRAFAILNDLAAPNERSLTATTPLPPPGPVVPVECQKCRIPEPSELDE